MDRGARDTDEVSCCALRSHRHMESEFLSRGRLRGTAILFGVVPDGNALPQFPRAGSIRRIGFRYAVKATESGSSAQELGISKLVRDCVFAYPLAVRKPPTFPRGTLPKRKSRRRILLAILGLLAWNGVALRSNAQQNAPEAAPKVIKVEPPNWWVGFTPEVMLLLSGQGLEATHASCNLPTLAVSRTQAAA